MPDTLIRHGQTGNTNNGVSTVRGKEVNRVAGLLGLGVKRWNDHIQGNLLTVRRITPKTEVVRQSEDLGQAMESLRRLAEERLGEIQLNSSLHYGTIAIQRYRRQDGSTSWLITIPGTDGKSDSPFGWLQNIELMNDNERQRLEADSARLVTQAMSNAGIESGEPVALIGHSQGGLVAASVASGMKNQYNIQHVVTLGSPVANHGIDPRTWVTSIEIDDELVPALDGAKIPKGTPG